MKSDEKTKMDSATKRTKNTKEIIIGNFDELSNRVIGLLTNLLNLFCSLNRLVWRYFLFQLAIRKRFASLVHIIDTPFHCASIVKVHPHAGMDLSLKKLRALRVLRGEHF